MTDTVDEQLRRGERAEKQVQVLLANERSLCAEIDRLKVENADLLKLRDGLVELLRAVNPYGRAALERKP